MSASLNFALNCQRYGISTPQCPDASLRYWANYTKQRSPTAYETYYAPLMAQLDPAPAQPTPTSTPEAGESFIREGALQSLLASFAFRAPFRAARLRL